MTTAEEKVREKTHYWIDGDDVKWRDPHTGEIEVSAALVSEEGRLVQYAVSLQSELDRLTARMKEIGEIAGTGRDLLVFPDDNEILPFFNRIHSLATGGER